MNLVGWIDQYEIRLISASVEDEVKVEAELVNKENLTSRDQELAGVQIPCCCAIFFAAAELQSVASCAIYLEMLRWTLMIIYQAL